MVFRFQFTGLVMERRVIMSTEDGMNMAIEISGVLFFSFLLFLSFVGFCSLISPVFRSDFPLLIQSHFH